MTSGIAAQWARKLVSVLALLASVMALVLIVDSQYGQKLFGESFRGSLGVAKAEGGLDAGQPEAVLSPAEENRYRALSEFVANRYRVSQEVAFDLVSLAHRVGTDLQLDPLLIIAVISVESRFNPIAESVAGAKGLMQVIPKYHTDKLKPFGGVGAIFDPETNIQVGSQILKEYIRHTGNTGIALQMYAGALGDDQDQYTNKVMSEKQRLQHVVAQTLRHATTPVRTASAPRPSGFPLD